MISTSIFAADKDIGVLSITNAPTWKIDVYTRAGQTNLVCDTRMVGDSMHRVWSFFQNQVKVGQLEVSPNSEEFRSEAGCPYSVIFRPKSPQSSGGVYVTERDGIVLNIFTYKDGSYLPADRREIREMADGQREFLEHVRELVK